MLIFSQLFINLLISPYLSYLAPGGEGEKEEVGPTSVGPTTPGPEPWWKIRLPRDVKPYHYDLTLHIDLNKPHFKGAVATWVDVLSSTPYVLLHAVDMNITKAEVRKVSGGEWQSHNDLPAFVKCKLFGLLFTVINKVRY